MGALSNIIKGTTNNIQKPAAPVQTGPVNAKPAATMSKVVNNTQKTSVPKVNITPPSRGELRAEQHDAKITAPSTLPTKTTQTTVPKVNITAPSRGEQRAEDRSVNITAPITPKTTTPKPTADGLKNQALESALKIVGDTSGKSVMDLYSGAHDQSGSGVGSFSQNEAYKQARVDLSDFYIKQVEPAYQSYQKARSAYQLGTGSYADAYKAWYEYEAVRSQYEPRQQALERLSQIGGAKINEDDGSEAIQKNMEYWNATMTAMEDKLQELETRGTELGKRYDAMLSDPILLMLQNKYDNALAEYELHPTEKNAATVSSYAAELNKRQQNMDEARMELIRLAGEYDAANMVYQTMGDEYGQMSYASQQAYYRENPEAKWILSLGHEGKDGKFSIDATYSDVLGMINDLETEARSESDKDKRAALVKEANFYRSYLGSGQLLNSMNAEELKTAYVDAEAEVNEARKAFESLSLQYNSDYYVPGTPLAQDQDNVAYMQAEERLAAAQERKNLIQQYLDDEAHQPVIEGLSEDARAKYDLFIERAAAGRYGDLGDRVNKLGYSDANMPGYYEGNEDEIRAVIQMLQDEGLTEAEAKSLLSYSSRKINAEKAEDLRQATILAAGGTHDDVPQPTVVQNMAPETVTELHDFISMASDLYGTKVSYSEDGAIDRQQITTEEVMSAPGVARDWAKLEKDLLKAGYTEDQIAEIRAYAITASQAEHDSRRGWLANFLVATGNSLMSGEGYLNLLDQAANSDKDAFTGLSTLDYNTQFQRSHIRQEALAEEQFQRYFNKTYGYEEGEDQNAARVVAEKKAQVKANWYSLAMSMGQSATIAGLTALGVPGALLLLSGSAATQTVHEMHEKGYSDGAALAMGAVAGFAEYITEQVELDQLFKGISRLGAKNLKPWQIVKEVGLSLGIQAFTEAAEEGESDIINRLADELVLRYLNGGVSQIQSDALEIQRANPGMTWEEAMRQAQVGWVDQFAQDVQSGFLSGLFMGAGGSAIGVVSNEASNYFRGRDFVRNGGLPGMIGMAETADLINNTMADYAKLTGVDTDFDFNNYRQIGKFLRGVGDVYNLEAIQNRLAALGEESISQNLLSAIQLAATDSNARLTAGEKKALKNSTYGQQVLQELSDFNAAKEQALEGNNGRMTNDEYNAFLQGIDESSPYAWAARAEGYGVGTEARFVEEGKGILIPAEAADEAYVANGGRLGKTRLEGDPVQALRTILDSGVANQEELQNIAKIPAFREAWEALTGEKLAKKANDARRQIRERLAPTDASASQIRYMQTKNRNPDATVMGDAATALQKAGMADASYALELGKILDAIFSGEMVSTYDLQKLDLNNKAVRTVWGDRTGQINLPANVPHMLKKTYVKRAVAEVQQTRANHEALAEGAEQLAEAQMEQATEALKESLGMTGVQKVGWKQVLHARQTARENRAAREQEISDAFAARQKQAGRTRRIDIDGLSEREVLQRVREQTGKPNLLSRSQFADGILAQAGLFLGDQLNAAEERHITEQYELYLMNQDINAFEREALQRAGDRAIGRVEVGEVKERHTVDKTKAGQKRAGQLVYEGDLTEDKIRKDDPRYVQVKVLDKLAKALGVTFHVFESQVVNGKRGFYDSNGVYQTYNGKYDPVTGEMWIDLNAGAEGQGIILITAAHELTHFIRDWSGAKYKVLADFLFDHYAGKTHAKAYIQAKFNELKNEPRFKNYDDAKLLGIATEEVVADSMGTMLTDGNVLQTLEELGKVDKSLADKIKDWLSDLAKAVQQFVGAFTPDSAEGKLVASMDPEFQKQLQQLFTEGLVEASERYAARETDIDGDPIKEHYSQRSLTEGMGFTFIESENGLPHTILDSKGNKVTHVTADMIKDSPLGRVINMAEANGFIRSKDVQKQRQFVADIMNLIIKTNAPDLVWEIAGTNLFSAIKANSDKQYNRTIDFTTICKQTEQMVNVMSEAMKRRGQGLSRAEVEQLYREVYKVGEPVPCPVCYVFSRWIGIGGLLDRINRLQNTYAKMSEAELRESIRGVETEIEQFAKDNPKADFFDKNGELKYGKILSEMKTKQNNRIDSINGSLEKASNAALYIQIYDYLLGGEELDLETTEFAFSQMMNEHKKLEEAETNRSRKTIQNRLEILNAALYGKAIDKATQNRVKSARKSAEKVITNTDVDALQNEIRERNAKVEEYDAYQWMTQTLLMEESPGHWVKNPDYKPVPADVLFDLNAGAEFAEKYPLTWAYRTTRGAALGKAITPYADARVGETIQGVALSDIKDIRIGDKNEFLNGNTKKAEQTLESAIKKMRQQNLIGGMRYQSTSDFRYEYGSDYLMTFFEMQAMGAKVQLYTKVVEAVDFLASVGCDINLSVMPLDDGFITLEDGTKKLVFSPVTGMNGDAAIQKSRQYNNVQPILVGISDEHIRLAIAGTDITFVIPFHGSGNTTANIQTLMNAVEEKLDLTRTQDYTKVQGDHDIPNRAKEHPELQAAWDLRMAIIQGNAQNLTAEQQKILKENEFLQDLYRRFYEDKTADEYHNFLGKEQAEQIFPYEYWDKTLDYDHADENGERFKRYCASVGVIPRFSGYDSDGKKLDFGDFSNDKGYWKLLIDRPMYNNKYDADGNWIGYGEYHEQQRINLTNFDVKTLDPAYGTATYGEVMKAPADPKKTNLIVDNWLRTLENTESSADTAPEMHSSRDFSTVKDGLNFNDPKGTLLERVFDKSDRRKKYETRPYNGPMSRGIAKQYLNTPTGIIKTGAGKAQLVGFWELGDGQIRDEKWLSDHKAELGNDGTDYEAKPGEKKWVYPIKWAERTDPRPVTSKGYQGRDISDITQEMHSSRASDEKAFADAFDQWRRDDSPEGERFYLGTTGDVLQGLGAAESDLFLNGDKILEIQDPTSQHYHPEMTDDVIKKLPKILNDPVLILASKNYGRAGLQNSRLVIFGSYKAANNQNTMLILDLRPVEKHLLVEDAQIVNSAYTKTVNPVSFVENSGVLYVDKNRADKALLPMGFKIPIGWNQTGYIGNIAYKKDRVKFYGINFKTLTDPSKKGAAPVELHSSRSVTDLYPVNDETQTPEYREAVSNWRNALNKKDEISKRIHELEDELRKESKPKPRAEWTDSDELDYLLNRRPLNLTDRGKEIQKELKELWRQWSVYDKSASKISEKIDELESAVRKNELQDYKPDVLMPAQQSSYQGFNMNEATNSYATQRLKDGRGVVVEMSPLEYLKRCAYEIFHRSTLGTTLRAVDPELAQKYAQEMRDGAQFPLPYLDYTDNQQEGRHRAVAAYLAGIDKIPVLIIGANIRKLKADTGTLYSTRANVSAAEEALKEIDRAMGKGTAKQIGQTLRQLEREANAAQKAAELAKEKAEAARVALKEGKDNAAKAITKLNDEHLAKEKELQKQLDQAQKDLAKERKAGSRDLKAAQSKVEKLDKQLAQMQADHKAEMDRKRQQIRIMNKTMDRETAIHNAEMAKANAKLLQVTNESHSRLQALDNLATEMEVTLNTARSDFEEQMRAITHNFMDLLNYNARTDKTWARGMYKSAITNTRAEQQRRRQEAVRMERQRLSAAGRAAIQVRNQYRNRANTVFMNDGTDVAVPVPWDPYNKDAKDAAEFGTAMRNAMNAAYRALVNATTELDQMAKLQTRQDTLSVWINNVRAAKSMPARFIEIGMLSKEGNIIGKNMDDLLLVRDANGKVDLELQAALNNYMFHKHNIDRMSIELRAAQRVEAFLSREENSWMRNLDNAEFARDAYTGAPGTDEYVRLMRLQLRAKNKPVLDYTAEESRAFCEKFEAEMPELVKRAEEIWDWWDVFMREWAVGSFMSQAQYEDMREMYPHYVPTYREMKGHNMRMNQVNNEGLPGATPFKKAKGSTLDLIPMEDQFVKSVGAIINSSRQNDLKQAMIEEFLFDTEGVFDRFGVFDWATATSATRDTFWDLMPDEEEETKKFEDRLTLHGLERIDAQTFRVSCMVNGVRMSALVNKGMFEGLRFLFDQTSDAYKTAVKAGNFLTKGMKTMITGANPVFAAKNLIRDQHTALANSVAGISFEKYLAQAAAKMATGDNDWINFQNLGGKSMTQVRTEGGLAAERKPTLHPHDIKDVKATIGAGVNKALDTLSWAGEQSESVTRFAEYLATLDMMGGDSYENRLLAIRQAAEVTVDFGRRGTWGTVINAWIPYWNPAVQGFDKAMRNILSQPDVPSAVKRVLRVAAVSAIPAALIMLWNSMWKRDKDYQELSDKLKDQYYCLAVPGAEHYFIKIPKSQDYGSIIASCIMRVWEGLDGRDDPMENFWQSAVKPVLPELPSPHNVIFVGDFIDLLRNKDYTGSAIIPYNMNDEQIFSKEQWDETTSWLAYQIGQLTNTSPMALDYFKDNYMGNFFGTAFKAFMPGFQPMGYYQGTSTIGDLSKDALRTVGSPFVADNRYSNRTRAAYYEMLGNLRKAYKSAGVHDDAYVDRRAAEIMSDFPNMSRSDAEAMAKKEYYERYMGEGMADFYEALIQPGGYADQISAMTKKAQAMSPGHEKSIAYLAISGLCDEALDFHLAYMNGEIEDPGHWMTYHKYGDQIMTETKRLEKYGDQGINFSGSLGQPQVITDNSGDVAVKYRLDSELQQRYAAIRAEQYKIALDQAITSSQYRTKDDAGKAAMLEAAKKDAMKKADQLMLDEIRAAGLKGEEITKPDWDYERKAAAMSWAQVLGTDDAYSERVSDKLLDLWNYNEQYQFMPTESKRETFNSMVDKTKAYNLDDEQQAEYSRIYHETLEKLYGAVMDSSEFQSADDETQALMLNLTKSAVNKQANLEFQDYLTSTGAVAVDKDQVTDIERQAAQYAIQRAMGTDNAFSKELTDELLTLWDYRDDYNFSPGEGLKKYFNSPTDDTKRYVLTEDQQAEYARLYHENYEKALLTTLDGMSDSLSESEVAARLQRAKQYAIEDTDAEFGKWIVQQTDTDLEDRRRTDEQESTEAKWDVQRILGREHAIDQRVTDELSALWELKAVGNQQFLPNPSVPTEYTVVNERGRKVKGYKWILDDAQREMYKDMFYDIYTAEALKVIKSPTYQQQSNYGKAQLLCAVRERVTDDVRIRFQQWLRTSNAPVTNTNTAGAQQKKADAKAAGKIVGGILG